MKKLTNLLMIGTLLSGSSVLARDYVHDVVKVDHIQKQIKINADNVVCASSTGGGTYTGIGSTSYNASIKGLHNNELLDSFGHTISFGNPYSCERLLDTINQYGEATVHLNEKLETVATDGYYDEVECNVFYRLKGPSYLQVGSQTYAMSSGSTHRFSSIDGHYPGMSCQEVFGQ